MSTTFVESAHPRRRRNASAFPPIRTCIENLDVPDMIDGGIRLRHNGLSGQ